jgi:VWFA-related protein
MKRLVFIGLLFCLASVCANAQSRRVPPVNPNQKQNERLPTPTPTPPAPESHDVSDADSDEVVEVDTRLVTIPVRVLDRRNRFIGGLKQESFRVYEDNVEQEIAYFTNEAQPFTVALVLDMSYSTTFKISEIQTAAISFIAQLRPEDKVIVISFDEDVHMLCEATSDRATIYRAIRSTRVATGTSLYEAVSLTMNDRLRSIAGRKAVVLFTDGVDTTSTRSNNGANLRDAMELDALIYPIRYDTFADVQSMKNRTIVDVSNPRGPIPQVPTARTASDKGTTVEEYRAAEEYLDKLATFTGGTVHLASTVGNLNRAFTRIASELREFYSLGYYPTSEGIPGKLRRIKVKVDRPNIAIRARDSYVVPKKKKVRTS